MNFARAALPSLLLFAASCASPSQPGTSKSLDHNPERFGVLVMAHGGGPEWNQGVLTSVAPLRDQYTLEVAFGMADAVSMQAAVTKLEARGVNKIGVVRLFISGESWYERTEQILGIQPGAEARPVATGHAHDAGHGNATGHGDHGGHSMEFWRIASKSSYNLSTQGLAEAQEMGDVLTGRARALSKNPQTEDVLILAHGPGDDAENERWIAHIRARASAINRNATNKHSAFRRVHVETLREDWPSKRKQAELRIRAFVEKAKSDGGTAIIIPFRVQGFGPYAEVLQGLDYRSDGQGLIPHESVTQWIANQSELLQSGPFHAVLN